MRRVFQEREIARYESALPKDARIRKVCHTENARRGRARLLEPFADGSCAVRAKGMS
jgi:hypothetical protein